MATGQTLAGSSGVPTSNEFPPLPRFDIRDYTDLEEKRYAQEAIEAFALTTRTATPLKPEEISAPRLGAGAFEVLSPQPLWGTFALASIQTDMADGSINLSLKKFDHSLQAQEMFYRRSHTGAEFNSPLFSLNGETIVFRDGLSGGRYGGYNIYLWHLKRGKLLYSTLAINFPHLFWSPGSRYLSFILGGDSYGDDMPEYRQALVCLDTKTCSRTSVMTEPGLCWSWTYDGHLLCARVPRTSNMLTETSRPSVYRVAAQGGKKEKLFDGGYYAYQSPDGQSIAFCDWEGPLIEPKNAPEEVRKNVHHALFLWDVKSRTRSFLHELPVTSMEVPRAAPQMVWSSDSTHVFVLVQGRLGKQVVGRVFDADVVAKTCTPLGQVMFESESLGWFEPRMQLSPDGQRIYVDGRDSTREESGAVDLRYTLWQMETATGRVTALARLTNVAGENPDWDFHDDSGLSPALMSAQKVEDSFPIVPVQLSTPARNNGKTPVKPKKKRRATSRQNSRKVSIGPKK